MSTQSPGCAPPSVVVEQADVDVAPHAGDVDLREPVGLVDELDDLPWNRQAHDPRPPIGSFARQRFYQRAERRAGMARNADYDEPGNPRLRTGAGDRRRAIEPARGALARGEMMARPSWPRRRRAARCSATRQRPQASYCYLLDADADLAQEFDLRMRLVARQVATVVVFEIAGRRLRPRAVARAEDRRPGPAAARRHRSPSTSRSATAPRPSSSAPGDLLQPCDRGRRRPARARPRPGTSLRARRASPCSTPPSPSASRPWPQIPLALLRARRQARRATSTSSARSPPSRGSRSAWRCCCGTSPRAGAGSSPAASASRCPLTHRLLGQLVGAERPSVSHALARLAEAGLVTGRARRAAPARHASSTTSRASWSATPTPRPTPAPTARAVQAAVDADGAVRVHARASSAASACSSTCSG